MNGPLPGAPSSTSFPGEKIAGEDSKLAAVAPELESILMGELDIPPTYAESAIGLETVWVVMRDGIRLATDLYVPPDGPAPVIAMRTPYGRARSVETLLAFARRGYVVVSQDCRGTGGSEPDHWDYYVYEREDSLDFVDWVTTQEWFHGFLGSIGGSYVAGTQWCMAMHPAMSATAPEVGGLGIVPTTRPRQHMFVNAYSRSVGKGTDKVQISREQTERRMLAETLASGYFNDPLNAPFSDALLHRYPDLSSLPPAQARRQLWDRYCVLPPAKRAELIKLALGVNSVTSVDVEALSAVFGHRVNHDAHLLPYARESELLKALHAPALFITGWYDWALDDTLATWHLMTREAPKPAQSRSRLVISPSAHNMPGYHEGRENHPELTRTYRDKQILELLLRWYAAVRDDAVDSWPAVVYYLMGANEWRASSTWPPPSSRTRTLYLGSGGTLTADPPGDVAAPDQYTYDPDDPTPTLGGSIVSHVYVPGSVDVSAVQWREDVLTYTTPPLDRDLDVAGSLRLILYASSSAVDTDFSARLSDVFPDGRAIQLQSGTLRARYRDPTGEPALLEPGRVHRLEIDMWATANRFRAGHRLRIDISSSDFPRFDRNTNRGGEPGPPIPAEQSVYHDSAHPSHIVLSTIGTFA